MTDPFKDYRIIFVSADGTRRRPLSPDAFREIAGCSRSVLLTDCIERFNTKLAREGATDRAHLEPKGRRLGD